MGAARRTGGMVNPHQGIRPRGVQQRVLLEVLEQLWQRYRDRVPYVQQYEQIVAQVGATFRNDHIAFRSLGVQEPALGLFHLVRLFMALGYHGAGCYEFPDKHLWAVHLEHPRVEFPKVFISELRCWELPEKVHRAILRSVQSAQGWKVPQNLLAQLASPEKLSATAQTRIAARVVRLLDSVPWGPVELRVLEQVNQVSQYAAWTLVHGHRVNHFTALVNAHGVEELDTIEKTVEAFRRRSVPMKEKIEGEPGSKLRQSATAAVVMPVTVLDRGRKRRVPWTYAYFEIAQRGTTLDPESGMAVRFEGFLGPQAAQLFEMTRVKK